MDMEVLEPWYYRGYVIQPHPDGYFVISCEDKRSQSELKFPSMEQAAAYIDNLSSGGVY